MPAPAKPVTSKPAPAKVAPVVTSPPPAPVVVAAPEPVVEAKPKPAPRPRKIAPKVEETPAPVAVAEAETAAIAAHVEAVAEAAAVVVAEAESGESAPEGDATIVGKAGRKARRYTAKDVALETQALQKRIADEIAKLDGQKVKHKSLLVSLRKEVEKVNSMIKKVKGGNTSSGKPGNPHGLKKPLVVTDAVAKFLAIDAGSERTRNDLTTAVCSYVKENNLQIAGKTSRFSLDSKLRSIFPTTGVMERMDKESGQKKAVEFNFERDGMSFLDLQVMLKHCFKA